MALLQKSHVNYGSVLSPRPFNFLLSEKIE
jgi:hypothetical protein